MWPAMLGKGAKRSSEYYSLQLTGRGLCLSRAHSYTQLSGLSYTQLSGLSQGRAHWNPVFSTRRSDKSYISFKEANPTSYWPSLSVFFFSQHEILGTFQFLGLLCFNSLVVKGRGKVEYSHYFCTCSLQRVKKVDSSQTSCMSQRKNWRSKYKSCLLLRG